MNLTSHLKNAAFVLAVFAIAYAVQKKVAKVPVVGDYLPGGQ